VFPMPLPKLPPPLICKEMGDVERALLEIFLPEDLAWLVWEHLAATRIRERFLRWSLLSHAKKPEWPLVRARLGAPLVRFLWAYPGIRREWRAEVHCWVDITPTVTRCILHEASSEHLWGTPSTNFCHQTLLDAFLEDLMAQTCAKRIVQTVLLDATTMDESQQSQ
jgi:hypothetical protein